MRRRLAVSGFTLILTALLLFGASRFETSSFLFWVDPSTNSGGRWRKAIGAHIIPSQLWRMGNRADQLDKQIWSSLLVTIDGQPVAREDITGLSTLDAYMKYDPFGLRMQLGTYGGSISVYINVERQAIGMHTARLSTTTTLGEVYSYSWTFRVE